MPEFINQMTTMMQTGEETDDRELDEDGDPIINDWADTIEEFNS
jgi:hypothetical protein